MAAVSYHMGKFPPTRLDFERLVPLIGPANAEVARYEGLLHGIPNAHVLLSPLFSQEAVLSSKIEGTQATLGEVLEFEAEHEPVNTPRRDDIQEVLNYRKAMRHAVSRMTALPLSQRLVRETHEVLMHGVRGESKAPGQYRRIGNYIAKPGQPIEQARYIPPEAQHVPGLMAAWEQYIHGDAPDKLVQLAIVHAEFEAIHPFMDGNGRIGRLLVPLFLVDKGFLSSPDFYISAYLESRRDEYYEWLNAVSREDDWTGWCAFFLRAIIEQAKDNAAKAKAILDLYQAKKDWMVDKTRSQYAVRALDWFFTYPVFNTSDYFESVDIPRPTATRILRISRKEGLLDTLQEGRGRRPHVLVFPELLDIAEGNSRF